jgi:G3E family GTPase
MIPLALVTGFLGCGKTTFLQQVAQRPGREGLVFLVNEFSALDVDGARLAACGPDTVAIPGGSIFCKCLVGEFLLQLGELPRRFPGCRAVVVEASGMADPRAVDDLLRDTRLDRTYELTSVVCLADPGTLPKLLDTLPALEAQLLAADVVLLNKCDLFGAAAIAGAEELIRGVNPAARIERTVRGACATELFGPRPARTLHGVLSECRDARYLGLSVALPQRVDPAQVAARLAACDGELLRAKGLLDTPVGPIELDWSMAGTDLRPAVAQERVRGLALIATAASHARVDALIAELRSGACHA